MRQHPPTGHVDCRRQIHEAAPDGNVADVHRPHAWRNLAGSQIRRPVRHDLHLTGAAFPATKRRVFGKSMKVKPEGGPIVSKLTTP
jgi:hypothetical protein